MGTVLYGGRSSDGEHVGRFRVLVSISDYFLQNVGYILSSVITESKGINIFKMDFFFRNILPTYIITFPVSGFIVA